jgi:glycosyltransferase involved in cell wall biosynthesis
MKICIISKYPPIEGGVSSECYWLAKALGEKGHEISIVTNAWEVEDEYKEEINESEYHNLEPKNVSLYSTTRFKSPILKSQYFTDRLTNLAVDIIKKQKADLILSYYMLPYGISGFISKKITNKPHIFKQAGSDIGSLYKSPFLETIFDEVLKDADKIIGWQNLNKILKKKGINNSNLVRWDRALDLNYFNPNVKQYDLSRLINYSDAPTFTYIGKISKLKKTYEFVNAASKIKYKKFNILFVVGKGKNVEELKKYIESVGLKNNSSFLPFLPPWKMPSILKASTCIVSPEGDETPFFEKNTHCPIIVREAMACGRCTIIGNEVSKKGIYPNFKDKDDFLIVDPTNIIDFKSKIEYVIDNPSVAEKIGRNARIRSEQTDNGAKTLKYIEDTMYSVL